MSNEIIPVTQTVTLGTLQASSSRALVESASDLATQLATIIERQGLSKSLQGKKYVQVEGWTTLAVMLGCIAREVSTIEEDGVYIATVELVRMSDGVCLSRASAECGDEKPWNTRPKYARRSMAQTRATSKVCRLAFSWIMTLAGYQPTPVEEMDFENDKSNNVKKQEIQSTVKTYSKITDAQWDQLYQQIKDSGLDFDRVTQWISKKWNVNTLAELPSQYYETLRQNLNKWASQAAQTTPEAEEL